MYSIFNLLQASTVGVFNVVRFGAALMAKNEPDLDGEKGVVINTVLPTSFHPLFGQVANETASASIEAMTRVWGIEFGMQGIRSVAIAQGNISNVRATPETVSGSPEKFAQLAHLIVTTPYINATTITLDGGMKQ